MNGERKKADLYVISGVTGMTGSELARQLVHSGNRVVGFDNFFQMGLSEDRELSMQLDLYFRRCWTKQFLKSLRQW